MKKKRRPKRKKESISDYLKRGGVITYLPAYTPEFVYYYPAFPFVNIPGKVPVFIDIEDL